ncbi:unnamed protein product [Paramecium sonneborni]|uniref:Uncharacterized protein n=1 Tax=Paramecium sonneborni TaxID=65129 RepID=A0A8S1RP31_9CILI|nr:unnamed protein product [Paramecium sonneborni]
MTIIDIIINNLERMKFISVTLNQVIYLIYWEKKMILIKSYFQGPYRNRQYFIYEQFYVIYCKFLELDDDHDFYISKRDVSYFSFQPLFKSQIN